MFPPFLEVLNNSNFPAIFLKAFFTQNQVEQSLRNFDLSEYRRVINDVAIWIYNGVTKLMEEELQPLLVPAIIEHQGTKLDIEWPKWTKWTKSAEMGKNARDGSDFQKWAKWFKLTNWPKIG